MVNANSMCGGKGRGERGNEEGVGGSRGRLGGDPGRPWQQLNLIHLNLVSPGESGVFGSLARNPQNTTTLSNSTHSCLVTNLNHREIISYTHCINPWLRVMSTSYKPRSTEYCENISE